ncbi:MAG: hypothetical protein B6241_07990 [Spirochaetaceae bacterium 4572_59]|nr:MAG: hypothetical protein B6241_07990 [Spirochaetaceae bacterium 4572_59]
MSPFLRKTGHLVRNEALSFISLVLGCLIMALAMNLFLIPNKIVAGGLSGVGTVLYHLFGLPVGMTVLAMNVPLFLASWKTLGRSFGIKTLISTILLSFFIDGTAFLEAMTQDLLLASIIGGGMIGLGLGLIFREDASTGGTDLAAKIIHKLIPFISIGLILMIIDAIVVIMAAFSFRQYELALYAAVTIFVTARVIDAIIIGVNYTKAAYIISLKSEVISERILKELNRGVTELKGRGMFTGDDRPVLLCVLRSRDIPHLKQITSDEDPKGFMFISDVREALGEGFSYEPKR